MVMIWIHQSEPYGQEGILLIIAVSSLIINTLFHGVRELFCNITSNQIMAIAERTPLQDAVMLDFRPPRPWKVHAGDYVYIRVPAVHPFSFAESHPFNVIWWDQDKSGKATRIQIISRVRFGFTRNLLAIPDGLVRLSVDGPYGKSLNTSFWDNFLFVATDIGISAQLPYLKDLIDLQRHPRRLGRVSIIWVIEDDGKITSLLVVEVTDQVKSSTPRLGTRSILTSLECGHRMLSELYQICCLPKR